MARLPVSLAAVVLGAAVAVGTATAPAGAAKKPPVKINGAVNNEGVGKVSGSQVSIAADSFFFEKTFLKAKPGTVTVTVENVSGVPHTFTIDAQGIDEQLAPGASKTVSVEVAAGKPVVFYCQFHRGSGMQGAFFTAKAGGSSTSSGGSSSSGSSSYGY